MCGTRSGQLLRLISVSEEGLSFSNTNGVSPVWRIKKEKRKGITNYQCPFGMDPNNYRWWLKVLCLSLFLSPGHDMLRGADQVLHLCLPLIPWNRLLLTNSGILFILFYWLYLVRLFCLFLRCICVFTTAVNQISLWDKWSTGLNWPTKACSSAKQIRRWYRLSGTAPSQLSSWQAEGGL